MGYFTLLVGSGTVPFTQFTVTDKVDGNISYVDSTSLGEAFTGVIPGKKLNTDYTVDLKVETDGNTTNLTWKVTMLGAKTFDPQDQFIVKFMAKVNGSHTNV